MRDRPSDEAMAELYRSDPTFAIELLNSILEDGDQAELRIAMRQMIKAFAPTLTDKTAADEDLISITKMASLLVDMGFRLVIQPAVPSDAASPTPTHPPAPTPAITAPQNAL